MCLVPIFKCQLNGKNQVVSVSVKNKIFLYSYSNIKKKKICNRPLRESFYTTSESFHKVYRKISYVSEVSIQYRMNFY